MNDIKDVDIDRDAHPDRPLASGAITLVNSARKFVYLLWTLSFAFVLTGAYFLHMDGKSRY